MDEGGLAHAHLHNSRMRNRIRNHCNRNEGGNTGFGLAELELGPCDMNAVSD